MVSLFQILREFLILIYNTVPSQKALYKLHIPSLCFVYDVSIMCMSCNPKLLIRLVTNIIFSSSLSGQVRKMATSTGNNQGKMSPLSQQL
jgi:hypothetical protein